MMYSDLVALCIAAPGILMTFKGLRELRSKAKNIAQLSESFDNYTVMRFSQMVPLKQVDIILTGNDDPVLMLALNHFVSQKTRLTNTSCVPLHFNIREIADPTHVPGCYCVLQADKALHIIRSMMFKTPQLSGLSGQTRYYVVWECTFRSAPGSPIFIISDDHIKPQALDNSELDYSAQYDISASRLLNLLNSVENCIFVCQKNHLIELAHTVRTEQEMLEYN